MNISIQKLGLCAATFALSACIRGGGLWQQDKSAVGSSSAITSFSKEDGSIGASFKGGSTVTQVLAVTEGELAGTELSVSPGSFSTNVNVTVTTGQSIANSSVLADLGVTGASSMSSASNSVAVLSDEVVNASKPFSLAIPVTSTSLNLNGTFSSDRLIITYKVTDASRPAGDQTVLGIIGRKGFEYRDGKVYASITRFGVYQVALADVAIQTSTEKASGDAILTAKQEKTLSEITFTKIEFDTRGDTGHFVSTTVSGAKPTACRFTVSKDKVTDCFGVETKIDGQKIYFDDSNENKDEKNDDGNDSCKNNNSGSDQPSVFYLRARCKFADGRFKDSPHSDAFEDKGGGSSGGLEITNVPADSFVPYNSLTDWLVEGTCKNSGTVVVSVRTVTKQVSCGTANGNWSARLDLSTVPSGDQRVVAQLLDYRNAVSAERSIAVKIDRSIPAVSISSSVMGLFVSGFALATQTNWSSFPVNGTCTPNGGPVAIQLGLLPPFQTPCGSGTWSAMLNLSTYPHKIFQTVAKQLSPAGREGTSSPIKVVVGAPAYGLGDDGNLSVTTGGSYDLGTLQNANSKFVLKSARVDTSINCAGVSGQCVVTFVSGSFIASNIFGNEEVMWIVNGSIGGACTSDVGKYGFARVASFAGSQMTIELTSNGTPPTISSLSTGNQCVVQIVRVPNANNLSISPGSALNVYASSYNWDGSSTTNGSGGVLALRVANTLSISTNNVNFGMSGMGFAGGSTNVQGMSSAGTGTGSTAPNAEGGGGGGSIAGGGGGGGFAAGGDAISTPGGFGGPAYSPNAEDGCPSCYFPKRAHFGAGGGGGASAGGGAGGGIVMVFAANVTVGALLFVSAQTKGADGNSGGVIESGGGAGGGTTIINFGSIDRPLSLFVTGGNAGAAGSGDRGAGGGAGFIHARICQGIGNLTTYASGGAGSSPGSNSAPHTETTDCI